MAKSEVEDILAFHINAVKLPKPVREFKFHHQRKWAFDFAFPDYCIAVEVEGAVYSGGRHTTGHGFTKDCHKYAEALILGWRVLRVTTGMVKDGSAINYLERLFNAARNQKQCEESDQCRE